MEPDGALFVLIGGAGFMGSAFANHLQAAGREVLVVRRGESLGSLGVKEQAERGRPCVLVDFAYTSVPNSSFEDPVKDYSDNLYNLLRHADFAKSLPGAVYVYVSSGGTVYGNPDTPTPMGEEHRNVPLAPYGITKLACERYALMYREVHGLHVKIVRPSNVYGPGQRPFRGQGIVATVMARLLDHKSVLVYGDGSTVRDYLFVDDFCRALHDVIDHGGNGETYNIGSGEATSITALLDLMKAELGLQTVDIDRVPSRPFDVRYNVLDSRKLIALNGWQPTVGMADGLARTAAWLKSRPAG